MPSHDDNKKWNTKRITKYSKDMKWYDVKSPCLVNRFQFSRQIKTISISVAVSM